MNPRALENVCVCAASAIYWLQCVGEKQFLMKLRCAYYSSLSVCMLRLVKYTLIKSWNMSLGCILWIQPTVCSHSSCVSVVSADGGKPVKICVGYLVKRKSVSHCLLVVNHINSDSCSVSISFCVWEKVLTVGKLLFWSRCHIKTLWIALKI